MFLPLLASPEVGEVSRSDGEVTDVSRTAQHDGELRLSLNMTECGKIISVKTRALSD